MLKFEKRDFAALDIEGKNYNIWMLDAQYYLSARGLGDTIKEGNVASTQVKDDAMIFLLHHLDGELMTECLTFQEPQLLWSSLKERYGDSKTEKLCKKLEDWRCLSLQNSKSVQDYDFNLFMTAFNLNLNLLMTVFILNINKGKLYTEADWLEKTLSTLHPSNADLKTRFYESGGTTYDDLLNILREAETNKKLVLKGVKE